MGQLDGVMAGLAGSTQDLGYGLPGAVPGKSSNTWHSSKSGPKASLWGKSDLRFVWNARLMKPLLGMKPLLSRDQHHGWHKGDLPPSSPAERLIEAHRQTGRVPLLL